MRIATVLSVAVLGVSTAALAQVANQSPPQNAASANSPAANEVVEDKLPAPAATATPAANAADAAPPPGEPEAASSAPPRS